MSEVPKGKVFKNFIDILFPDPHDECGPTPPPSEDRGPPIEASELKPVELDKGIFVDHYIDGPR